MTFKKLIMTIIFAFFRVLLGFKPDFLSGLFNES